MLAGDLPLLRITINNHNLFLVATGAVEQATERIVDKRAAPEFDAPLVLAASGFGTLGTGLKAHPVHRRHVATIGDGVASLNAFPCPLLGFTILGLLCRVPSDGRGIDEY